MYVVFDENGKEFYHNHAVDAKEAIAGGRFFSKNPTRPVEVEPDPVITPVPGQDIEPIYQPEPELAEPDAAELDLPVPDPEVDAPEAPPVEEIESGKKRAKRQA